MQHLAASRGYEDITLFLIQEGVDINQKVILKPENTTKLNLYASVIYLRR